MKLSNSGGKNTQRFPVAMVIIVGIVGRKIAVVTLITFDICMALKGQRSTTGHTAVGRYRYRTQILQIIKLDSHSLFKEILHK